MYVDHFLLFNEKERFYVTTENLASLVNRRNMDSQTNFITFLTKIFSKMCII